MKLKLKSSPKNRKRRSKNRAGKDGNTICQLGIAAFLREKEQFGVFRDHLNRIVHSKDKNMWEKKLEYDDDTDKLFKNHNYNPSDYCTSPADGADVCQRGLGVWFRRGNKNTNNCYDDLSDRAVHSKSTTYEPEIDLLLKECSGMSLDDLDKLCRVPIEEEKRQKWKEWKEWKKEQEKKIEDERIQQQQKIDQRVKKELKRLDAEEGFQYKRGSTRSQTRRWSQSQHCDSISGW